MIVDRVASYGGQLHQFAVPKTLSRRSFLQVGAAASGGLVLSLSLPLPDSEAEAAEAGSFVPNAFIRIDSDGQIVLTMPYVEMGQGTYTSIPMLIAEELEVDLKQVQVEHAPPNEKLYANPLLGVQATGNSNAIRSAWQPLREAGALRESCWWRQPPSAGMSIRHLVAHKVVRWCTRRPGDAAHSASLPPTPPACLFPKMWHSSRRKISSLSAHRPSASTRQRRSMARRSMASTFGRRA